MPYDIRVEWDGPVGKDRPGHGHVTVGNIKMLELTEPPCVLQVQELHFIPSIHWFEVRELAGPPRPMEAPEIQLIYAWLNGIIDALRHALRRQPAAMRLARKYP